MTITANIGGRGNEGKRASHDPTGEKLAPRGAATLRVHGVYVGHCCHVTKQGAWPRR